MENDMEESANANDLSLDGDLLRLVSDEDSELDGGVYI